MKKQISFILFILLVALIAESLAGSQKDKNVYQVQSKSLQNTIKSAYQDIAWGNNVQKQLRILKTDLDGVSSAANNSNYTALTVYAQQTVNDTQNAIQENDQYTVSPKLQNAQKEWRLALQDYNSAGHLLLQGANEVKNVTREAENLQKARTYSDSGTYHLKKVSELAGIK